MRATLLLPLLALPLVLGLSRLGRGPRAPQESDVWTQAELEEVTRRIERQVEELRGLSFERPVEVALADREKFLAYVQDRLERTESPEDIAADEMIAKLLGLIPAEMDLLATTFEMLEEQVGGFYDPETESFYLMESFTGGLAKVILAHELTHALDDQHFDLDGTAERVGTTTDRELAFHSVVEGSGTAFQNRWLMEHLDEIDLSELAESAGGLPTEAMGEAPPYLWKPLLAAYLRGEAFLRHSESVMNLLGRKVKPGDVDEAFAEPPRSTEQVLHPKKYWKERRRDEPRELRFDLEELPGEWEVVATDTMGELFLGLVTTPLAERDGLDASDPMAVMGVDFTNDAAEGWGGDRLVLLARGPARILHLVTVWDSAEDAEEFREALLDLSADVAGVVAGVHDAIEPEDREGTLSGFRVSTIDSEHPDSVRVTAFVGVTEEELAAVLERLTVREES